MNLIRCRNSIGWLSRDIEQYPMFEISNSGLQTQDKEKVLSCLFLESSHGVYTKTIIHLRLCEYSLRLRRIIVNYKG